MYRDLVSPHLDFGSIFIKLANTAIMNSVNSVQNAAFKVVLGCMRSTPVDALHAETGEGDLDSRRLWLAVKFMIKMSQIKKNTILRNLCNLGNH